MAFEFATGTLNIGTGALTTTYSVTGKTGTWKAVILFWTGRADTTDATGENDIKPGIGVAVSSTSRWAITTQVDHNQTTMASDRYHTNAACVATIDIAGAVSALADFVAFTADGFTLVVDDVFPAALEVSYILLGGADLTNVSTGFINLTAATGAVDFTGVGFQADFLLLASAAILADPVGGNTQSRLSIGAATAAAQAVTAVFSADNVADSITSSYSLTGEVFAALSTNNTTVSQRSSFTSFAADGFQLNNVENPASARCHYLALKGGTYSIGSFVTATDTNAFTEAHGMAVTPKGALFLSSNRAVSTADAATAYSEWSVGASDGTVNTCQYTRDKDAAATSDAFNAVSHDQCYLNASNDAAPVIEGEGHVNSFDSTNINFQMTDADPAASFVWYVAFGDEEQVATPIESHVDQIEVTLTCPTVGATIYYTTDGSTPDDTDTEYTAPFILTEDTTVKAIAIKPGFPDSEVVTTNFTIAEGGGGTRAILHSGVSAVG